MEIIPVSSSTIQAIGYDYETATLRVEFLKSGAYCYSGVSVELYEAFLASGSKGQFLDQYIKKEGYPFSRC